MTHDDMGIILIFLVLMAGLGLFGIVLVAILTYKVHRTTLAITGLILDERKLRGML